MTPTAGKERVRLKGARANAPPAGFNFSSLHTEHDIIAFVHTNASPNTSRKKKAVDHAEEMW
jgi:hypothetical protein